MIAEWGLLVEPVSPSAFTSYDMSEPEQKLLKTRRFLPIFLVQFLGAANDNIFKNAIIILITFVFAHKMDWSVEMAVAFAGGLFILPFFLFSALAGQLADHYDKDWLVRRIKFTEILVMAVGVIGFYTESLALLLTTLFFMGAQSAFFGPIKYGILPCHLKRSELMLGNALVQGSTFIAILIGTMIGGFFIMSTYGIALISSLVLVAAIVGWVCSFYVPEAKGEGRVRLNFNIIKETWRLYQYVWGQPRLLKTILGIAWFWFVGATWLAILPVFVKDHLGGDETVVTFFLTLFAVGIGLGAILCNRLLRGHLTAKYVPYAALGVTTVTFVFAGLGSMASEMATPGDFLNIEGIALVSCACGVGIFGGFYTVPMYALLQYWSVPTHRARNVAALNVTDSLFVVLSAVIAMIIYAIGGNIFHLLILTAVLNIGVAAYLRKFM